MKKTKQNVLAKNSNGEIVYICGKCGYPVDKEATICPRCNARLGDIKCPFCGFTGGPTDFRDDTCPKCGRKRTLPANLKKGLTKIIHGEVIHGRKKYYFSNKLFWLIFFGLLFAFFGLLFILYRAL